MKDELEKYITNNKSEFDEYKLDEVDRLRLWSNISDELPRQPKKVISIWKKPAFKIAASIMILLGFGLSFIILNNTNYENSLVDNELYEIDNHYKSLVDNQIKLIKNNPNLSDADQDDFLLLINDLDAEYNKLKKELKTGVNNEKIIKAIINNYRKKIQLMENLLNRLYPTKTDLDDGEFIL